jgi:hypothetical protein
MALGQRAVDHEVEHVIGQLEQAHRVRDSRAALADAAGDLGLGEVELVGQNGVGPAWSTGFRSSRATFSASARMSSSLSSATRTIDGMVGRPASRAARQRRSPATIS